MTPRCLFIGLALMAALSIPFAAARADDDAAEPPPDHSAAAPSPDRSAAEPALAEPSAPEPSRPEAAPPEAAPSDYSPSDSSDDGETRQSAPSGSAAASKPESEEKPVADKPGKKKDKKAKPYDYERSKYKSREMSENTTHTYRFNEKGEPVVSGEKKKPGAKKTKRSASKLAPDSCGSAESCAEKKSDADAL